MRPSSFSETVVVVIVIFTILSSVARLSSRFLRIRQSCWLSCHARSIALVVVISTVVSSKFGSFFHRDGHFLARQMVNFFISTRRSMACRHILTVASWSAPHSASNGPRIIDFGLHHHRLCTFTYYLSVGLAGNCSAMALGGLKGGWEISFCKQIKYTIKRWWVILIIMAVQHYP